MDAVHFKQYAIYKSIPALSTHLKSSGEHQWLMVCVCVVSVYII